MPEKNEKITPKPIDIGDYQFGFHDDVTPIFPQEKESAKLLFVKCQQKKANQNGCLSSA